jgi:hypothetical protein
VTAREAEPTIFGLNSGTAVSLRIAEVGDALRLLEDGRYDAGETVPKFRR